jgi:hypothetical protein
MKDVIQDQAYCPVKVFGNKIAWAAANHLVIYNIVDKSFELNVDATSTGGHTDAIRGIAFSPDGSRIATVGEDKRVIFWASTNGNLWSVEYSFLHNKKLMTVDFLNESGELIFGDKFGDIFKLNVGNERAEILYGHLAAVTAGLWSRSRNLYVSADRDEKIRITEFPKYWNISSFLFGHKRYVSSLCFFDAAETKLVSAGADGLIALWDLSQIADPKRVWFCQLGDGPINSVAVRDNEVFVVRTDEPDRIVRIRDGVVVNEEQLSEKAQTLLSPAGRAMGFIDYNSHLRFMDGENLFIAENIPGVPVTLMKFVHHENLDGEEYGERKRKKSQITDGVTTL